MNVEPLISYPAMMIGFFTMTFITGCMIEIIDKIKAHKVRTHQVSNKNTANTTVQRYYNRERHIS